MIVERARWLGIFTLCLLPFLWLVFAATTATLGPDPAEAVMHVTGEWSLRMLVLTLLVSPLRRLSGWQGVLKFRRMLGLYAFFYSCVHLVSFCQFYVGWEPAQLAEELIERPYITVGFTAWLLMLPLALTSTRGMQRRLRRNWLRLHRAVYAAGLLACVHLFWQSRSDIGEALLYLLVVCALLGWRLKRYIDRRSPALAH